MKKIIKFIKEKCLYLLSLLTSIYFVYLFVKKYTLGIKGICFISLVMVTLFFFLTRHWTKKNKNLNFDKKHKIWIGISSFILTLILMKCGAHLYVKDYVTNNLSIVKSVLSFITIYYMFLMYTIYFLNNKDKRGLLLIILSCLLFGTYYFTKTSINVLFPDSNSYIYYDFTRLWNLKLNGRTPIYPVILNTNKIIFETNFLTFTCMFQYIVWFIGIICLYETLSLLVKNKRLNVIISICYVISPAITLWNNIILTESIALSGTLIFIYLIVKYIITNKCVYGYLSVILSFILTFHRPTSIIYLLGLFLFFIFRMIFEKPTFKSELKCFAVSTLSVLMVFVYAYFFHKSYGIYSISDAVVRQDLIVSIEQGYYKSSENKEFVEYIDKKVENGEEVWSYVFDIIDEYGHSEIKKITNDCRMKNIDKYILYIGRLGMKHSSVPFTHYSTVKNSFIASSLDTSFSVITFFHVYIVTFLELILLIVKWVKNKKVPWINAGLFAFPFIIVMSSFIGTCNEFMRTAICCVPFTFIGFVMLIDKIFKQPNIHI